MALGAAAAAWILVASPNTVFAFCSNSITERTSTERSDRMTTSDRKTIFPLHQQQEDDSNSENTPDSCNINNINNSIIQSNKDPWLNLLVAATFVVTATLGAGADGPTARAAEIPSNGLDLVSPGTATIEVNVRNGDREALIKSTQSAVTSLTKTALLDGENRAALTDSVQRLNSSVKTELTSVEAWQKVITIFNEYGVDLQQETDVVIRPPADLRRMYDDVVENQQVNLLVNGEILQITTEYHKGSNEALVEGETVNVAVQPDDEWILRVRGYKGFDPTALNLALEPSRYHTNTPQWFREWNNYWNSPLSDNSGRTHGDVIVFEGATAIALSYAVSYAYHVSEIEKAEEEARQKQANRVVEAAKKKKKAAAVAAATQVKQEDVKTKSPTLTLVPAAAANEKTPPKETTSKEKEELVIEEKEEAVNEEKEPVKEKKLRAEDNAALAVIETSPSGQRRNGLLPFLQALYFPWMGFFFSSSSIVGEDNRPKIIAFVQALYFPWAGVFFPKLLPETRNATGSTAVLGAITGNGADTDRDNQGNNGVLPFIRALWFPWIGILQGK